MVDTKSDVICCKALRLASIQVNLTSGDPISSFLGGIFLTCFVPILLGASYLRRSFAKWTWMIEKVQMATHDWWTVRLGTWVMSNSNFSLLQHSFRGIMVSLMVLPLDHVGRIRDQSYRTWLGSGPKLHDWPTNHVTHLTPKPYLG